MSGLTPRLIVLWSLDFPARKRAGFLLPVKPYHYSTIAFVGQNFKKHFLLIIIILIGGFLRLNNLSWGDGYFFHPDERNIISAVTNISFGHGQFNPQFWAYGAFPIYVVYAVTFIFNFFTATNLLSFEHFAITGRVLAALSSIALIPLTYLLVKKTLTPHKHTKTLALIGATWVAFSPGMIQFAHFGTFESLLTLEYMLLLLLSFTIVKTGERKFYILFGIMLGLSVGTKITSVTMAPLIVIAHLLCEKPSMEIKNVVRNIFSTKIITAAVITIGIAVISSPYHVLDWNGFMNSLNYESGVANGSLPVFYTQQFINTTPVLYQLTRVFPYILTIPLTLIAIAGFAWMTIKIVTNLYYKTSTPQNSYYVLLISYCVLYLSFNFALYVKWTRYMIPAIPVLIIIGIVFLSQRINKRIIQGIIVFTTVWSVESGLWFMQVYERKDTRVQAADWIDTYTFETQQIGSEVYDLGILPTNNVHPVSNITLYNIYDSDGVGVPSVESILDDSDIFISLSQRIYNTRLSNPSQYPQGNLLYETLFNSGQWDQISFSTRDIDCAWWSLWCMGGIFPPDETFFVFDHPSVYIFERR